MSYRRKNKYHYKEEKRSHIVFSTDPLSLTGSTQTDKDNEKCLINVLKEAKRLKESKYEAQRRELVLQALDEICQEWVRSSARKHNLPEEFASHSKVRLFAFGSYKLDVHSMGDDVDLLCVGPNFLTRDMFFDELGEMLVTNACVEHFYAVRNAYVPVMSFKYNGVDIDMVYAQLQIELLDKNWDINNDSNLRNLDNTSILSLNGVRLAERTLKLVPNRDTFRLALRAIRYWAKQRGIYSNKLGYLGGVSWAILTARVCQLYPKQNAAQIVQNFFLFYHIWNFGTPLKAITLCPIVRHEEMPSIKVWDPNDQTTKYELMHIITPAFPAMNSTHNVSMATFEVLKREIARSFHLLTRAEKRIDADKWRTLFSKNTFFIDHRNYIFVKACAPKKSLTEWGGLIESKIRSLVGSLEHYTDVKVTPYCKALRLKLTQKDINKHTNPEVLKQMDILRKKKLQKLKQKKLKEREKKRQDQKLRKIQLKLQKERELERIRLQKEQEELQKQQQKEEQQMDVDITINDKEGQKQQSPSNQIEGQQEETKLDQEPVLIPKLEPEPLPEPHSTNDSQTEKNTVLTAKEEQTNNNEEQQTTKTPPPIPSKSKSNSPSPSSQSTQDDDVLIVSNLSMPLHTIPEKKKSKSPSPSTTAQTAKKSKSNTPNTTGSIQQIQQKPSNPYIYVAPELQRKYQYRRNRRGGRYGRGHRYNGYNSRSFTPTSLTPNPVSTGSPAPSNNGSTNGDKETTPGSTKGASPSASASATAPIMPSPNFANPHAFVVGKSQISCCKSFNTKILKEKAEKYGYECKAFVIGLKVMNRTLAIETTADGHEVEHVQRFDFSRSVVSFLKGLNHIYTDSHLIIELINCNKIPHFLFEEHEYKRPDKEFIKKHQIENEKNHELWKSKSCIATMDTPTKKAVTASPSPQKSASSSGTPKFDKDDILMNDNDEDDDVPGFDMPGMGGNNGDKAENFDVNQGEEKKVGEKRKIEDMQETEVNSIVNNMISQPPTKRRRLDDDDVSDDTVNANGADIEMNNGNATMIAQPEPMQITTNNAPPSQPTPVVQQEEKEENVQYQNRFYDEINWDKKFDRSPTFEYAYKLYRNSQNFTSWQAVAHSMTATATYVHNTCKDQKWKNKFIKVISNEKYGWNGCKYSVQLNKKLMFDLAHDIAYNYIKHKNEKKRKRKF